jgi:hypothetical protein
MRLLYSLKRYWFYALAWFAGLGLLWVVTPIQPIIASTINEGQVFIGFIDGGQAFVTLGYSRRIPNGPLDFFCGPLLVRDTETGVVKQSLFTSADRFVNLFVERDRDYVLRSVRKKGKTAEGNFKYILEWIDTQTGSVIFESNPISKSDFPENRSTWFPAALSRNGQYVVYEMVIDNEEQMVCVNIKSHNPIVFTKKGFGGMMFFSPDGRYLKCGRNGGIVILESSTGREILDIPHPKELLWSPSWWSPDSKLIYTSDGSVWNVATGQRQASAPTGIKSIGAPRFFTADSREIISTTTNDAGVWLVYHDVNDGNEIEKKRLLVLPGIADNGASSVSVESYDGRFILVHGNNLTWNEKSWSGKFQSVLHYLQNFFQGRSTADNRLTGYTLIDGLKNKIMMVGEGNTYSDRLSPDGRYIFVNPPYPDLRCVCWPIPPRKAIDAFLYVATAWLLGCLILRIVFHFLSLGRRKASTPVPGG